MEVEIKFKTEVNMIDNIEGRPEGEVVPERTKESEIKANVEFWKDSGFEINEADVRKEIESVPEVEGFDWYSYLPEGIKISDAWDLTKKLIGEDPKAFMGMDFKKSMLDKTEMPRDSKHAYAFAARYQREPETTFGEESPEKLEKMGNEYTTPLERLVIGLRYYFDNKEGLDAKNSTICLGSRINGLVPNIGHEHMIGKDNEKTGEERVNIGRCWVHEHTKDAYPRRVITKNTPLHWKL